MAIIWKWNGTLEQIRQDANYLISFDRASLKQLNGKTWLDLKTFGQMTDADRRCGFNLDVTGKFNAGTHFFRTVRFYIPTEQNFNGWANLVGFLFHQTDPVFDSGRITFFQKPDKTVRYQGVYYTAPAPRQGENEVYGGYLGTVPIGEEIVWTIEVYIHPSNGFVKHWFNGVLVWEKTNICTFNTYSTPKGRCYFRNYHNIEVGGEFHLYITDMVIYTELNDIIEPIPEPPVIIPATRTLVAQALPFPLLLAKLWRLRTRFIREDIHRKVHPLI